MVQQPLNAEQTPEDRPINIGEMDFAFLTAGDPEVEPYDQLNRIQQNLDQEEQQELAQLAPYVERFFILSYKAENGEYPPDPNTGNISREQYTSMIERESDNQFATLANAEQNTPAKLIPKSQFDNSPSSIPGRSIELEPASEKMQLGGQVQQTSQEVAAGPVGEVQVEGKDTSGTADDVQTKSDGYILSKGAVITNGKMYIYDLIDEAIQRLKEKGIELDPTQVPESAEDILVSNGEIIIPDIIAQEIGYKRLEKMNKRGEQITEELIAEKEQGKSIQPPAEEGFATPKSQGFNEGGLTGQEQYVQDMEETINILDEQADDKDPNIEVTHLDQFPAESPAEDMIYQFPRESVKKAIAQHEWKNQNPQYGFVALSGKMRSSAYGPGQMIMSSLANMSEQGVFGDGELKQYAEKIIAAQTLFINHWVNKLPVENYTNIESGIKALKTLGITEDQYKKYLKEGYFTPSNRKSAKDQSIPREILGKNAKRNYDFLWDAFIDEKIKRKDVTGINTFLTAYHGGTTSDDGEYVQKVRKILDRKN